MSPSLSPRPDLKQIERQAKDRHGRDHVIYGSVFSLTSQTAVSLRFEPSLKSTVTLNVWGPEPK